MEGDQRKAPFLLGKRIARPHSPIWTGQWDGILGQTIEDREGGDREMSQQNLDSRGDYKVGTKIGETGELQV